jgi:FtsH-binding integral membrane protein
MLKEFTWAADTLGNRTTVMYDAQVSPVTVAEAPPTERAAFIRRTYGHLAMAILAFVAIEVILFQSGAVVPIMGLLLISKYSWLVVLGAFIGVSWLTEKWAESSPSVWVQYLALSVYVVAEAIIFVPMLVMAVYYSSPHLLPNAVIITGLLFLGLTMTAFTTRKDFSFLRGILCIGGCIALGVIVASIVFGFELGMLFSAVMILFAGAAILYSTSKVIHKYNTNQHVAAALSLFAAIALLFWYVLRLLMAFSRR